MTYDIFKKFLKRWRNGKNSTDNTSTDIHILIYIDLFIILIHIISMAVNFVFSSDDMECEYITKCCTFLFHIARCILYLIFVRRIHVIYGDTIFALNKCHIYLLYIIITIYSIPYLLYFNWNDIHPKYDEQFGCLLQYKSYSIYLVFVYILHVIIAIYCLFLFIYPLHRLIKSQEDKQISYKLYNILIKYCLLYSSSILSSFILIIISYLLPFGYNYAMIDSLINGMILILLHPIHNKLYKSLCCLLHSFCIIMCEAPSNDKYYDKSNATKPNPKLNQLRMKSMGIQKMEKSQTKPIEMDLSKASDTMNTMNTMISIRDIMKERAKRKFNDDDIHEFEDILNSPSMRTCSPPTSRPTSRPTSQPTSPPTSPPISPPTKCSSPTISNNNDIEIIMDDTNDPHHEIPSSPLSIKSFGSLKSLEFEQKKSNTLNFINYESNKL